VNPDTPEQDAEDAVANPGGVAAPATTVDGLSKPPLAPWMDWAALGVLVVIWGSAFAGVRISAAEFPPGWVAFLRLAAATVFLSIALVATRDSLPRFRNPMHPAWRAHVVTGILGLTAPFFLFAFAGKTLPSAVLAMCNGATPIVTATLAHFFLVGERITLRRAAGIFLGACGFVTLAWPRLNHGLDVEATALLAAIAAACIYSCANMLNARAPRTGAVAGALMMCLWATAAASVLALIQGFPADPPSAKAWIAVLLLGALPTGLGTLLYVHLIQRRGPVFMAMSVYLIPLWATGLGILFMHERPQSNAYVALILILMGIFVATRRRREA
jgi:drug/metabolite transporter (DMT)-like permease